MRSLALIVCLAAALLLVPAAGAGADSAGRRTTSLEAALLQEVNAVRAARGLSSLKRSGGLSRAADLHTIAMLKAGLDGPFATIVAGVTRADGSPDPAMYFWATGVLSSFLDNAPTYLVFFNTAGGDPQALMGPLAPTLAAISAGAVFMGANSYIGNAPNLMVKAVAEDRGVPMPSFFGYMAWSCAVLLPLFALITLIWFR